jgi:GDP-mannose 6-dehydrogenase
MPQRISVFGLGYVGSVTAACLAHRGHQVIGVDVSSAKVDLLASGKPTVLEKGLDGLTAQALRDGKLFATLDASRAITQSDLSYICVGTPPLKSGEHDLSQLDQVLGEIGAALRGKLDYHTVVIRSTVLPGSTEKSLIPRLETASGKQQGKDFGVCYNPEFLREGSAVSDFLEPTITVIGACDPAALRATRQVYDWVPGSVFETSLTAAEAVKSVCNAFHALKITFANEIGTLCKRLGVDTETVFDMFKADTRLNCSAAYLNPGFAFGGSCLPKDLRAMIHLARRSDVRLPVLDSILSSNDEHVHRAFEIILRTGKKKIAILGLSFKAGTDDLRESPMVQLSKLLLGEGFDLRIWDHDVSLGRLVGSNRQFIDHVIPHIGSLLVPEISEAVRSSDVIVVGTSAFDREQLVINLRPDHAVIDLVNLKTRDRARGSGTYEGICW